MNIFEIASRKKLRFSSEKGELTVEQLWDLPLKATDTARDIKTTLNTVAIAISDDIDRAGKKSFVDANPDPRIEILVVKLDVVKHIIAVKLAEAAARVKASENHRKRGILYAALESAEQAELLKKTPAEIRAELEKLDADLDA